MKTRDKYSYFGNLKENTFNAIGLMSGTSLDGVDIALIKTDGEKKIILNNFETYQYSKPLITNMENFINTRKGIKNTNYLLTKFHADSVLSFLKDNNINYQEIDIIGFHGQTIYHSPNESWTWQLGDGNHLSTLVNIPVVSNFRYRDICLGGQGAPLVGIWHKTLLMNIQNINYPCVFINVGGVSNITYIDNINNTPFSFDIGVGNGPLDLVMQKFFNKSYDVNGKISFNGDINHKSINNILNDPWYKTPPPKSIDKNYLNHLVFNNISNLKPIDQAATLSKLISIQLKEALKFFDKDPKCLYISGGGAKNIAIMEGFFKDYNNIISSLDDNNWNADAMEAQAFAYLAVRSIKSLPYTYKIITGVNYPTSGGLLSLPNNH